jgi:hypothetical protein
MKKVLFIVVVLTIIILSCTKEKEICVTCTGIDPLIGFDANNQSTACHEDSTTAFKNALNRVTGAASCSYEK